MAIREIRTEGDEVLRKRSREVDEITERIKVLIDDMEETMYHADGIGLAAPQVGVLKRVIVIDPGDGFRVLINPVIIDEKGKQSEIEGCLSLPDFFGEVERPEWVKVEAMDVNGDKMEIEGDGLLARVICHEIDHLDGILFKDKVTRVYSADELQEARKKKR